MTFPVMNIDRHFYSVWHDIQGFVCLNRHGCKKQFTKLISFTLDNKREYYEHNTNLSSDRNEIIAFL